MSRLEHRLRVLEFRNPRLRALAVVMVSKEESHVEAVARAQQEGQDTSGLGSSSPRAADLRPIPARAPLYPCPMRTAPRHHYGPPF